MNPRPTAILQAAVAVGLLLISAVLGWRIPTIALGAAVVVVGLAVDGLYIRQRRAAHADKPTAARHKNDILVRSIYLVAGAVPAATAGALCVTGPSGKGPVLLRALTLILSVGTSTVLLSSIFDWFWIVPRISGLVRRPPWVSPADPGWRVITRVWLLSRSLASLVMGGSIVAVPLAVAATSSGNARTAGYAVAGVLVAAGYPALGWLRAALHPPVSIAEGIKVDNGVGLVVDVSVEGAGFVYADRPIRTSVNGVAIKDGLVSLDDLPYVPRLPPERLAQHAFQYKTAQRDRNRRLEVVDPLDAMLNAAAEERERVEVRQDRQASVAAAAAVATAVLSVAAASAQIAISSTRSIALAAVAMGYTRMLWMAAMRWKAAYLPG